MKFSAKLLVPILAVSLSQIARAITITSASTGDWSLPASWDSDPAPAPDTYAGPDNVLIDGFTINYDAGISTPGGGFAIANGNNVTIGGAAAGTLTQTVLTQMMRVGEGSGTISGAGSLTIDTGSILDTGAAVGLVVGSKISGATFGNGLLDMKDGLLLLGAGASANGLGVGIDGSDGILNVGDGLGGPGTSIVNLLTNNIQMFVGNGTLGGTTGGAVSINSDGIVNFGTGNINIGLGGGTGAVTIASGGSLIGGSGAIIVGDGAGSSGTLTNAGTISGSGQLRIGTGGGTGAFTVITGGTATIGGQTRIGSNGGNGTLSVLSAGAITLNDETFVGADSGTGAVNLASGGTININHWLNVGRNGGNGTITQTGGTFAVQQEARIGVSLGAEAGATGALNLSGGTFTSGNQTIVGANSGSTGTLVISGGSLISSNKIVVGSGGGTGVATISSGSASSNNETIIGDNTGSTGALTVSGGNWTSGGEFQVGNNGGTGVVNMTGGTITAPNYVAIGRNTDQNGGLNGGNGTVNLSGGTIQKVAGNGTFDIGSWNGGNNATTNTTGTINQTGGSIINTVSETHIGRDAGTVGLWTMTAGTATLAQLNVGNGGTGTMTVSGTAAVSTSRLGVASGGAGRPGLLNINNVVFTINNGAGVGQSFIGKNGGSVGTVNVSGAGAALNSTSGQDLQIGFDGGTGNLNITNGGQVTHNWWVNIARGGTSTGNVLIDGANSKFTQTNGHFNIGENGAGTVTVSNGGALTVAGEFYVARNGGSTGTYTQTSGSLVTNQGGDGGNTVGRGGQGTMNVTGGTVQMAGALNIGTNGGTGLVNITNAVVTVNGRTTMGRDTGNVATTSTLNIGAGGIYNHQTGDNGDFLIGWQNGSNAAVNVTNGGTVNYSWWTRVGVDGGSNGSILLNNGANWNQTGGRVFIGEKSTGSLTITNNSHFTHTNSNDVFKVGGGNDGNNVGQGTLTIDATSSLSTSRGLNIGDGRNAGISSTGVANVTGGTINAVTSGNDEHFKIGTRGGVGTLNVTNGGDVTTQWLSLGQDNDSNGTATFDGIGTTLTSRGIIVGWSGSGIGTLHILNGAVVNNSNRQLSVARDNGNTTGVVNISNGSIFNAGRDFRIGHNGNGTVNINSGTFNSAGGWGIIGDGGASQGFVNLTNGNFTHTDTMLLSANAGAQGTFTQNGASTTLITGELIVGRNGTGTLHLNGGTFTVGAATQLGRDSNTAVGTINIASGAILNAGRDLKVGQQGIGTVNINGGTLNSAGGWAIVGDGGASVGVVNVTNGFFNHLNDSLLLGNNPGAQGTFTQSGASSVTRIGNELIVSRNGSTGILNVAGGTFTVGNQADVGRDGNGTGTINVSGTGTLTLGGNVNLGRSGNGTGNLMITGGTLVSGGEVNFGYDGGTTGNGTVTGGRMTNTSFFIVGRNGTGTFTQSGGSVNNTSQHLRVGNEGSGVGTFNMSGGIYTSFGHGMIGESGNGTLNLSGGIMNIGCGEGGNLFIGHNNGSSGLVNMLGGLLKTDGGIVEFNTQGGAVLSTLNLNGGILATNYLNNPSGNGLAIINVNGGTLRALSDEANFIRAFATAQVQLTGAGLTVDTDNRTVSINMALGGAGGITKTGLGQLNLTTTQANTGATRVNSGVLNLDFSAVANTANLVANAGLTLAGGTLRVNGSSGGVEAQSFTGTSLLSGASAVTVVENGGGTASVNLNAITRSAGSTVDFTLPTLGVIATSNLNDAGGLLSGGATVGDTWASVTGGNIAAYAGGFSATFGAGLNFDTAASATDGGTVHSIRFSGGPATVTLNANSTVVSGGILVSGAVGANDVTISQAAAETLTSGNLTDLIVIQNNAAGDLIIGAQIDGAVALTKSGVGELILTNAGNSYAGGTFINAGTVTIGADGALGGAAGGITFAANSLASGGVLHTTATMTLGAGRSVTLNSGGGGFDVDTATTLMIGQGITGSGGLGKLGAGILSLTGANTYTGATAVYAGELQVTGSLTGSSGLIVNGLLSVGAGGNIASTGEIHIAQGGGNPNGTLTISGAGASVTGTDVIIGENGTGTGTANISNGGTLTAECRLYVGRFNGSNGVVNVGTGGVINANEWMVFGSDGGSTGTGTLSGDAILNVSSQLRVANDGTGSLTLNDTSTVNLLTRNNHYIGVGGGSNGTLTVNGGKVNFASGSTIEAGWGGGSTGNLIQSGGELAGNPLIVIGRDGTGTAAISGGTTTYRGFEIGNNGGSGTGTVTLSGTANVIGAASVYVGRNSGNATLNLNGGTLTTNGIIHEGSGVTNLNFNGTTIKPNADNANFINNFSAATTDVQAGGAIFDTNGKTIKVTTDLDGVGALTKNGNGTLTLNGNSSYAGGVNLNTGTISVRHDNALGTGTVIGNGGRLSFDNSGGAGLLEGRVTYGTGNNDQTSPIPADAITLGTPKAHSTDAAAFGNDSTWGYRGKLVVPAGGATWSFAEQFDDNVLLKIDGNTLLNDTGWNNPTQATVTLTAGEHDIEVRFGQGGGGVGPNNGWNIGFGIDYTGAGTTNAGNYVALTDPGDGSRLRYNDEGFIDYTVANAAVLNVTTEVFVKQFGANLTGNISGAGGLNKTGAGRLTITGTNTYGTTNIAAGVLEVGNGGATGTLGSGTVTNATLLKFNRSGVLNVPNVISGIGAIEQNGPGTTALSGVNTYSGGTTINNGTLNVNADAALGALSGGVAINSNATLQAAANVTTNRTVTLGTGGGQIDANGNTVTLDTLSTLTGTALTTDDTAGGGVVNIKGVQTYSALTTEGQGVTNMYTALGTGTSTITANATLNIYVSQTLASLDIGAGTEVTFGDGLPFTSLPPAKFGGGAVGVVPEPGSLGLLLVGALGFIARRRRS